jgi:alkanesulfonate monooxygenase SsuD/methylene tetrahydromethanopterin reductase-like flavin-dependent oxidoreductase (luciferase family)
MDFSTMVMSMYVEAEQDRGSDEPMLQAAVDQALAAARYGFNPWTTEHHFRGPWHSAPLQFAAWLAPQMPEDRYFGFGVVSLPYHHPVRLVEQMNLLDQLTRGRVLFGVGSGFPGLEPASSGLDPEYHRSGQATRDSLAVLERLWDYSSGDAPYEFDTGQWRGQVIKRVVPSAYRHRRPPLIRTARDAAATIDAASNGWSVFLGTYGAHLETQWPLYCKTLMQAGHGPDLVEDCLRWCTAEWRNVVVAEREDDVPDLVRAARQEQMDFREKYAGTATTVWWDARSAREKADSGDTSDVIGGTPEMIAGRVRELDDQGINHLLIRFLGQWQGRSRWVADQSMRLFSEQVMPQFTSTTLLADRS